MGSAGPLPASRLDLALGYYSNQASLHDSHLKWLMRSVLSTQVQTLAGGGSGALAGLSPGGSRSASILSADRIQRYRPVFLAGFGSRRFVPLALRSQGRMRLFWSLITLGATLLVDLSAALDLLRSHAAARCARPLRRRRHSFSAHRPADGRSGVCVPTFRAMNMPPAWDALISLSCWFGGSIFMS